MKAIEYLKSLPRSWLPMSVERGIKDPSNSELQRWLNQVSVVINNQTPHSNDEIEFPITKLVFFPKGKRKTTLVDIN